jgi:hypothetical protein
MMLDKEKSESREYMMYHYGSPLGEKETPIVLLDLTTGKEVPVGPEGRGTVKEKLWLWLVCEYGEQIDVVLP